MLYEIGFISGTDLASHADFSSLDPGLDLNLRPIENIQTCSYRMGKLW